MAAMAAMAAMAQRARAARAAVARRPRCTCASDVSTLHVGQAGRAAAHRVRSDRTVRSSAAGCDPGPEKAARPLQRSARWAIAQHERMNVQVPRVGRGSCRPRKGAQAGAAYARSACVKRVLTAQQNGPWAWSSRAAACCAARRACRQPRTQLSISRRRAHLIRAGRASCNLERVRTARVAAPRPHS